MTHPVDSVSTTPDRPDIAAMIMSILPVFSSWFESVRDRQFEGINLGHRQISILYVLRHGTLGDIEVTPSALSTLFGVQPSVITRVLTRLESSGHITRTMDPGDARSQFIRITPAGNEISLAVENYYVQSILESMRFIGDDELPDLRNCIDKLGRIAFDLENRRRLSIGREPLPPAERAVTESAPAAVAGAL